MPGQAAIFHALLRPAILQVLRATGYHATRGAVLDSLTDLAARYMQTLCEKTAAHATHARGDASDYTVVELRMALQDMGALMPDKTPTEQAWAGVEDMRGVDEFLEWFQTPVMKDLLEMGNGDGESDATDYLSALKKKHSKTGEDSKWNGTLIGRPLDTVSEIQVEGGPVTSIDEWITQRSRACLATPQVAARTNGHGQTPAVPSPASSGLSSVGDRLDGRDGADRMDLT